MRPRLFCPIPWRILVPIVFLTLMCAVPASAGRNANGALIVHTNDAVTYTGTADYCATSFLPASCEAAVTRTDKDENTPAVIWLLAAFPDTSSPAVTTIQFGIEHNLPANEGYFEAHGKCAELEMPDAGWPETGFGNLVSFGSTAKTDLLFTYYWFAAYGFEGAYFSTTTYPSTEESKFVDDSVPPVEDLVTRFGAVRWSTAGENSCPPSSDSSGSSEMEHGNEWQNGGEDLLPLHRVIIIGKSSRSAEMTDWCDVATLYGYSPLAVTLEEIRTSHPAWPDSLAIQDAIRTRLVNCDRLYSYVLLVGGWAEDDAHETAREIQPWYLRVHDLSEGGTTCSDQPYGDLDGDGLWDVAVWRVIPTSRTSNAVMKNRAVGYYWLPGIYDWEKAISIQCDDETPSGCAPALAHRLTLTLPASVGGNFSVDPVIYASDVPGQDEEGVFVESLEQGHAVIVAGPSVASSAAEWIMFAETDFNWASDSPENYMPPLLIGTSCHLADFDYYGASFGDVICRKWMALANYGQGPIGFIGPTGGTHQYANGRMARTLLELLTEEGQTFGRALLLATRRLRYLYPEDKEVLSSYCGLGIPWQRLSSAPGMAGVSEGQGGACPEVQIFPNPVIGTASEHLRIVTRPGAICRIGIYTTDGRVVRRLDGLADPRGGISWDLRDDHARRVCNGVYLVKLDGTKSTRKVVVLK